MLSSAIDKETKDLIKETPLTPRERIEEARKIICDLRIPHAPETPYLASIAHSLIAIAEMLEGWREHNKMYPLG